MTDAQQQPEAGRITDEMDDAAYRAFELDCLRQSYHGGPARDIRQAVHSAVAAAFAVQPGRGAVVPEELISAAHQVCFHMLHCGGQCNELWLFIYALAAASGYSDPAVDDDIEEFKRSRTIPPRSHLSTSPQPDPAAAKPEQPTTWGQLRRAYAELQGSDNRVVGERVRHKKRGTTYTVRHREARLQTSPNFELPDMTPMVVYQGDDGQVWCRPEHEFDDGRFEPIPPPPAAALGQGEGT